MSGFFFNNEDPMSETGKARRRKTSEALLAQAMKSEPVSNVFHGLGKVALGAMSGYRDSQMDKQDANSINQDRNSISRYLGGASPQTGGVAPPSDNVDGGGDYAVPTDKSAAAQKYIKYLVDEHDLSPEQASGVVGNAFAESSFNPNAIGDNGTSIGMFQHRNERAAGLKQFAAAQDEDHNDPEIQVDYAMHEMQNGSEKRAWGALQNAKTPQEASTAMMHFERPAGYTPDNPMGGHNFAKRAGYSANFYKGYAPQQSIGQRLAPSLIGG